MTLVDNLFPEAEKCASSLDAVCRVLDSLIEAGKFRDGLWPACLTLKGRQIPEFRPGVVSGQRNGDRSWSGCNLMHDLPALNLLYALDEAGLTGGYASAADDYLRTFFRKCVSPQTGLFLWGEHAFWDLIQDGVGNSALFREENLHLDDPDSVPLIHDHLRMAAPWFWEKAAQFSPGAVQGFADGLDRHWIDEARTEYNRHAHLARWERLRRMERSCDFPRHSGHYVVDLACAYRQQPRENTRRQLERYAVYWWERSEDGECLPIESRSPAAEKDFYEMLGPAQTLSLGVSLLDAASCLGEQEAELAGRLSHMGKSYCWRFLEAPHCAERGIFVSAYDRRKRDRVHCFPLVGSVYGIYPVSQSALLCCAAYRVLGDDRLVRWAENAAQACVDSMRETPAGRSCIPALDIGLLFELLADLTVLTRNRRWLEVAGKIWPAVETEFFSQGLVRLVADGAWYEAQQGSAYLLHGVARVAMLLESSIDIGPDYSAR